MHKKRIIYRVRRERLYHPDIGHYTAYGIAAQRKYPLRTVEYISDVDVSRRRTRKIAALLNYYAIDPTETRYIIEDIFESP